jgi:hypothetical protein
MAIAGTRVSTVEKPCFPITTSPEAATLLYTRNICKDLPGCLANLASRHCGQWPHAQNVSRCHRSQTQVRQSNISNQPHLFYN